jgi:hypothetical protein
VKEKQKADQADDFVFDKRLYIIFLISFTEVLGFSMVLPLIPFLGQELGLTLSQILPTVRQPNNGKTERPLRKKTIVHSEPNKHVYRLHFSWICNNRNLVNSSTINRWITRKQYDCQPSVHKRHH